MKSYLLVADVLGFSNIVSNTPHDSLSERIETWIRLVEEVKHETDIDEMQLISDTIFAREADSDDGLERLLRFSKSLLERGVEKSFFIRGAITHGEVSWGKLIYGDAVIKAVELERSLDWIGIACKPLLKVPWSWELVCEYLPPQKSATLQTLPVIVWDMPLPDALFNKWTGGGALRDGEFIPWESYSKLRNTIDFFTYIRRAKRDGLGPEKYDLTLPWRLHI